MKRKYLNITFLAVSIYIIFMSISYLVWTIAPKYDLSWLFCIAAIGIFFIPVTIAVFFVCYLSNPKLNKEKAWAYIVNFILILLSTILIYVVTFEKFSELWTSEKKIPANLTIAMCVIIVLLNFYSFIRLFVEKVKKYL